MKRLLKNIEKWFDIYIAYFLYNDKKKHKYYEYINKKYNFMVESNPNDIYEVCIICGCKTTTLKTTHVDFRYGYVEGAGQMCRECYIDEDRKLITINSRMIIDTPNDLELGKKVRQLYWDSKK
jgi:hypothetical protein